MVVEAVGRVEHVGFLARCACREQHCLARHFVAYRKHCLEDSFGCVVTDTAYFAGGSHIHAQHRVGALEAREAEL